MNTLFSLAAATLVVASTQANAGTLGVFQSGADGFDTKTYWYDDGREVTVFDTQFTPALAQAMLEAIRRATANPITRVVVTHPNPDKFNGLSVFHALGATSIGSAATQAAMPGVDAYKRYFFVTVARMFTEASYPRIEPLRETFSGTRVITLASGETITLSELRHAGVSSTQTVARIDATGDLIVGDLVHAGTHAWLEGGIVDGKPSPDIAAWIAALDELRALGGRTVHGGRGDDAPVQAAISDQQDYLRRIDALVSRYADTHRATLDDARHPAAIQALAAAEFPDRRLAYLVGYGVYGLLGSKR